MPYLTLGYLTLDMAPEPTVAAAAEAGFGSVGIRITGRRKGDPYTQVTGNPAMIADIRRRCDDGGLRLSNISAYHVFPDTDIDDLRPIVDATAALGSDTIVVNGHDPDEERFTALLARYAEEAAKSGIAIALEWMIYSGVKTLAQARGIIRRAAQPNIALLPDPLHLARSGGVPADLADDPTPIRFAQLCDGHAAAPVDARVEARTQRQYPGDGELPLAAFLAALPPDTEIEIEVPYPANAGLPAGQRARIAHDRATQFLAAQGWQTT